MPIESPDFPQDSSKLNHVSLIWSIAEILRGDFKAYQYGSIILPFVVLRRLECVLEPTRAKVLEASKAVPTGADETIREKLLNRASGLKFSNATEWTLDRIKGDSAHLLANTNAYINGFTANVRDVLIDRFKLPSLLEDLDKANLLYSVIDKFSAVDLHPQKVSNMEMGSIFEELIRRFAEVSNETAGEHFTPRDIVELLVDVLFLFDAESCDLTLHEVAQKLNQSYTTVYRWVHGDKSRSKDPILKARRTGRSYRISSEELESFKTKYTF